MNLPRIVISQTHGSIAIEVKHAKLSQRTDSVVLNMTGNAPKQLQMTSTLPRIKIDSSASTSGMASGKKPLPFALENYGRALQDGINTIGLIASEGLNFLRIEENGNPIYERAVSAGVRDVRLTIKALPSERPQFNIEGGDLNIDAPISPVSINWQWIENQMEYTPYEVNISMAQYPSIEISVEPGIELEFPVNNGVGVSVDEAV